ncbi:MAG: DMT family transporter [Paracoccaceae bacterium]
MTTPAPSSTTLGILFVLAGVICISVNDLVIKQLSGDYSLHQSVFIRSTIGILFSLILVQLEGGWRILRTKTPFWHAFRGILIVIANMTYFAALAALPLADVTALFFAAPLFITLLSIPILGEKVGLLRMGAVSVGFIGVVIMQRPWEDAGSIDVPRIVLVLPVIAAFTYALNQILTRKLGGATKASAMAVYIQATFIVVSLGFYVAAGDGRYAQGQTNESLIFLLRAWTWPTAQDWPYFIVLGVNSAAIGYCLSQAYRLADAATVAPYEYIGLPLAVFWGWVIFAELPVLEVWIGIALILGAGLFVFLREQQKSRAVLRASKITTR